MPMKKTFHAPRLVEETTLAELTLSTAAGSGFANDAAGAG
jgi:hypothetical protein